MLELRAELSLLAAALFVRNVELLRWSNVDGRLPGPSLFAATPGRALDDEAGKARRLADSDGE